MNPSVPHPEERREWSPLVEADPECSRRDMSPHVGLEPASGGRRCIAPHRQVEDVPAPALCRCGAPVAQEVGRA